MNLIERTTRQRNISKFIYEISRVDWQFVLNETETQLAFGKFHEVISVKYNVYFYYRTISKKYYKNKHWLSTALQEFMKSKNKLYAESKRSDDSVKLTFVKKYRNNLNQLIRSAWRELFFDILLEHKSNMEQNGE